MTESETAWIAGLLEGEGSFILRPGTSGRRSGLRVSLEMCDEDVVRRAAALSPSKSRVRSRFRQEGWSTTFQLHWGGKEAETLMRAVLPYMGERRSTKIKECLNVPNLSHTSR